MRRALAALLCALVTACDEASSSLADASGIDRINSIDAFDGIDAPDAFDASQCSPGTELTLGTATGTSLSSFRPLADGDSVFITPGPQGGQHIWVALRGRGFDPTLPRFEFRAYRSSDDVLIGRLRVRLPMIVAPEDPTRYALSSQTLVLDDRAYCSVLGADVRIELDFDDLNGHCAMIRRTVHAADLDPTTPENTRMMWRRCCDDHLPRCYGPMDASTGADVADAP